MASATTHLMKIQPASDKDKATLEKAKKELEEGASALVERQKHIRIADQSEHSWETVAAYIGSDVATAARRIEKAEKTAEQRVSKRKRTAAATAASQRAKRPAPTSTGTSSTLYIPVTKTSIWAVFVFTASGAMLELW